MYQFFRGSAPLLRPFAACVLGLLLFAACVDDRYDLNEVDTEITFGADGITLPLGRVERQSVRDLLADSGMDTLRLDTDEGYYAYRIEDSVRDTVSAIEIRPVSDVIPAMSPAAFRLVEDGAGELTGHLVMERTISKSVDLPDEISAIDLAEVVDGDTGETARLVVTMEFDGDMPDCTLEQVRIELPDFLEVEEVAGYDAESHALLLGPIPCTEPVVRIADLPVRGVRDIPVRTTDEGRKGMLDGLLGIRSDIRVSAADASSVPAGAEYEVRCSATLPPMRFVRMTGRTDIDLSEYLTPTDIDCGDLSGSLGEGEVELNLVAPQIAVDVRNPLGIALVGDIFLTPHGAAGEALDSVAIRGIRVEAATDEGPRLTRLYVTDAQSAPAGYELCRVENLADLVRVVPSYIEVSFDLQPDESQPHRIVFQEEPYDVETLYAIRMPLAFREGARIEFSDSEDVSDTIGDLDIEELSVDELLVRLDARSTLPLALEPAIEFLAADGSPVGGVTASVEGRLEAYDPATGEEWRASRLDIRLEVADGDLRRLNDIALLRYRFTGETTGAGAALAPDQYIEAGLVLELGSGITYRP